MLDLTEKDYLKQTIIIFFNNKPNDRDHLLKMIDSCNSLKDFIKYIIEENNELEKNKKDILLTILTDINNNEEIFDFFLKRVLNFSQAMVDEFKIVLKSCKSIDEVLFKVQEFKIKFCL